MPQLLIALIPLISAGVSGESISAALGTLSVAQWVTIAADSITAGPQVLSAVKALHPAIATFLADVAAGVDRTTAAKSVHAWFVANRPATIPGYAADGGVIAISNPDKTKEI